MSVSPFNANPMTVLLDSSPSRQPLGSYQTPVHCDLKQVQAFIYAHGAQATTEQIRLSVYPTEAMGTAGTGAIASSDWIDVSDIQEGSDHRYAAVVFTFSDAVPTNLNTAYHLFAETQNYTQSPLMLDVVLDYGEEIHADPDSTGRRPARLVFLGYADPETDPEEV